MYEKKHRGWGSPTYTEKVVKMSDGETRKDITSPAAELLAFIWKATQDNKSVSFTIEEVAQKLNIEEFKDVFPLAVALKKAGLINIISVNESSRLLPFEKMRLSLSCDFTVNLDECLDEEQIKIKEAGVVEMKEAEEAEELTDSMKISFLCNP